MLLNVIVLQVFMKIIFKIALNDINNLINVSVNQINAVMDIGNKSQIVIVLMEVLVDYNKISFIAQLVNQQSP